MSRVAHNFKDKSRTGDVLINENVEFGSLLLSEHVLRGLKNSGFVRPSPIQLKAIPLGRCGLDLIVQAKSGTGKTCVFSVIALESILTDTSTTQVLVLAPTREIAVQIWEVLKSIGSAMKELECHTFIGGLPLHEDRVKLKKCHIAVGSPGRIKQLIESGALRTDSIRLFVLDEADKLLEESFQEQINWIYSALPENKQMLALSATYPEYLAEHLTAYMRNPTFLRLNISDPALLGIRQYFQTVPYHPMSHVVFEEKSKVLINILSSVSFEQCLVFSNLQTRAQTLANSLTSHGWPTACIAGCLDQKDRNHAMARLKTYKCRILISTDLTSRGIDADKVNMVINLDIPQDHETYLHRIGRAGRFGSFGIAITLISDGKERLDLDSIEKQCNTQIFLLPDPLPSDLAKPDSPVFLDDVVSSEVIETGAQYQAKSGGTTQTMKSPSKFIELDKDTNNKQISDTADKTNAPKSNSKEIQLDESLDMETGKEEMKVTVNGFKEGNSNTKEEMLDYLGLTKNCEDFPDEFAHTREAVVYEDIEYNEMNEIEFIVEGTGDNSFVKTDLGPPDSKIVETGYVSELEPKLDKKLVSIHNEDADDVYFAKDDLKVTDKSLNDNFEAKRLEEVVTGEKMLKSDSETSCRIENQVGHTVESSHVPLCRSSKISSLPLKEVNISDVFKHNIGYKKLDNSHSYNAAKDLLKTFRNKVDTEEELTDNKIDVLVPKVDCQDTETDELKQAVSHLQNLLENHLAIYSTEAPVNANKTDSIRKVTSEDSDVVKTNSSISSEDEFEAKDELLNRVTEFPLPNLNENELLEREASSPTKLSNAGSEDEQTRNEYLSTKDAVNFTAKEKSTTVSTVQNICTDDRNKNNLQKARKQRFGYQGNFAVGHLLQQERVKGKSEKCLDNDGHFGGASDTTEQEQTKECDVDNVDAVKETHNALPKNAQVSFDSKKTESELSLLCYENQEQPPCQVLNRASRNKIDVKLQDKGLLVHRIDESDDKETDSESFSVSSVTDSESTVSEHLKDKGARPKMYSKDKKTQSGHAKEIKTSDKQGRTQSKTASRSSEGDVNSEFSYQELYRQWYEQYENWHKQCRNMWGYPGMHQTYFQNVNPYGNYYNSSMNYPYQNFQQGYPYNYTQSSYQVEKAFQFQDEYLKQMSKYWRKRNGDN